MTAVSPTARQLALLRFIAGYQHAHDGVSPSIAECAVGIGAWGKANVHQALVDCERRGLITRLPGKQRAIRLLVDLAVPLLGTTPLYAVPPRRDQRAPGGHVFDNRRPA
jgi:SOS-response transcriptional repressor LexA